MPAAVRFVRVSKRFRIGESHDSLRDLLTHGMRRILGRAPRERDSTFLALDDVTFEIAPGEALGIIGPNGAGKSTALKLLAGILRPDRGKVEVCGRRAALIEVGAGFHGDLTGRENIYLNGTILGMNRGEIRRKLDAIVSFAGVERFLDMPVKRYSSGMYARLGFSIAAHVEPDVLLVDEVLSVGDAVFRLRCLERMRHLVRAGTALAFVTHDLEQMRTICGRTVVLEHGAVAFEGSPGDAVTHYLRAMSQVYAIRPTDIPVDDANEEPRIELAGLRILDGADAHVVWVGPRQPLRVELTLRVRQVIGSATVELNLRRATGGENLATFNSGRDSEFIALEPGSHRVCLALPALPLSGGQYFWNVRIWDNDSASTEVDTPFRFPMVIDDGGRATGALTLDHDWSVATTSGLSEPGAQATGRCHEETGEAGEETIREGLLVR
ncbi:MAG: ABC transporter ATP-binding protein [Phycisphaerales bacterium]|nr:ABC transporter ATP-binding protein [Phycisphaerales bacterium]